MRVCFIFSNSLKNIVLGEEISFARDIRLLLPLRETNKMLQHTSRNSKHLQSNNVHENATSILQYTYPWWWPKIQQKVIE